jgi:hypothetical protein
VFLSLYQTDHTFYPYFAQFVNTRAKMGLRSDLQIAQPLTLKCGLTLPNRLVKAAMAEQLAGANQLPDERMQAVYKQWSAGGWGMIITGTRPLPPPPFNPPI